MSEEEHITRLTERIKRVHGVRFVLLPSWTGTESRFMHLEACSPSDILELGEMLDDSLIQSRNADDD
jgi:hypothetical protein